MWITNCALCNHVDTYGAMHAGPVLHKREKKKPTILILFFDFFLEEGELLNLWLTFVATKGGTSSFLLHDCLFSKNMPLFICDCGWLDLWSSKHHTARMSNRRHALPSARWPCLTLLFVRSVHTAAPRLLSSSSLQLSPSSHRPGVGDHTRDLSVRIQLTSVTVSSVSFTLTQMQWVMCLRHKCWRRRAWNLCQQHCLCDRRFLCAKVRPPTPHGSWRRPRSCATGCTASANIASGRCRNRCTTQTIDRIKAWRAYKCRRDANATPDGDLERTLRYIDNSCLGSKVAIKITCNLRRNGRGNYGSVLLPRGYKAQLQVSPAEYTISCYK